MNIQYPLTMYIRESGERFDFKASSRTGRFRFEWTLDAGKTGPGEHCHDTESESFAVRSGTLRIWMNGTPRDYRAGESVTVPAGVPHRFLNPGREPVVVDVELDGDRMEAQLVPMAVYFQRSGKARPSLAEIGRIIVHVESLGASSICSPFVRALFRGAARLASALGARPFDPVPSWAPVDIERAA